MILLVTKTSHIDRIRGRLAVRLAQRADLLDRLMRSESYARSGYPDAWDARDRRTFRMLVRLVRGLPVHVRIHAFAVMQRQQIGERVVAALRSAVSR